MDRDLCNGQNGGWGNDGKSKGMPGRLAGLERWVAGCLRV